MRVWCRNGSAYNWLPIRIRRFEMIVCETVNVLSIGDSVTLDDDVRCENSPQLSNC